MYRRIFDTAAFLRSVPETRFTSLCSLSEQLVLLQGMPAVGRTGLPTTKEVRLRRHLPSEPADASQE